MVPHLLLFLQIIFNNNLKYLIMSKSKEGKNEKTDKKAPAKNLKEKRAAKEAKRDEKTARGKSEGSLK
jgi:hypothetical protein